MTPMALASPGLSDTGKFKAQTLPASISSLNRGRGLPVFTIRVELRVTALLGGTERSLDQGVVIESQSAIARRCV
jgi:hypothetical protein